ncbi:MAG: alpha-L-fucosidase, partial [Candidatus Omnitrophica bacterium]|nr:alpha-L-fucosidase [Candidatus Omnitrophota bacterium]
VLSKRGQIEYAARKGEEVRIVGGRTVTGWKPVTDPAVLERLDPAARKQVFQADLKALGITDLEGIGHAGTYQSDPGLELFFADKPMTLARYPNQGYMKIAGVLDTNGVAASDRASSPDGRFVCDDPRTARWMKEKGVWLHGFWVWDWADERIPLGKIDPAAHTIGFAPRPGRSYEVRKGQWFYAENVLPELDSPGEWYLDRDTSILYFWPTASLDSGKTVVSRVRDLFQFNNASNITLRGFVIEAGRGNAVVVKGGSNARVAACTIRNMGNWAVKVYGGTRHGVVGCDIYQTGQGGIHLEGGDRKTLTPAGHYANNNHIHHTALWDPVYQQAIALFGVGNYATHNLIDHVPHVAIGFSGNDQTIEYNEIHDAVFQSNDAGAIYTSPPDETWSMRGHKIRFNYLHDIHGFEGRGCNGVYLDDCFSSADISDNIFYRVATAILIGGGRDNIMTNNMFIDCGRAFSIDARGLGWAKGVGTFATRELIDLHYQQPPWSVKYPEILHILEDEPLAPKGNVMARNISWGGKWGWTEPKAVPYVKFEDNLVDMDPLFAGKPPADFRLKEASPAWKLGFRPIPFDQIGLYKSDNRASWPVVSEAERQDHGHQGVTLYVSKLGDNSDGSSWAKAFRTIQAALLAVPDDQGGHRIIIRPDTYVEANLYAVHKGAPGAYNLFWGDYDGSLGSGATGWVVVDSSAPGVAVRTDPDRGGNWKIVTSQAPESGFKSVDWWGTFTGPPGTFSDFIWDRWVFRHIYATGGEGGFGLYTVGDECRSPCTLVVEDCVGIGRFAGALLAGGVGRKDEPVVFRNSYFMNLDCWGDAGGVYVRTHHASMPDYPDVIIDNCTIVSPDNALQAGFPGFDQYTRVKLKDCRLITLNFSQPRGTPSSGIICCDTDDKYFRVDLEDCVLAGFKVFGTSYSQLNKVVGTGTGNPSYSIKGRVQAYVQYEQPVPKGMERLGLWPVKAFGDLVPPAPGGLLPSPKRTAWFSKAKFGLFVHWGPFAVLGSDPEAKFNYSDLKESDEARKEFAKYAARFNPKSFDAAKWIEIAKAAGTKYLVFTSKHHDGYAMFDSRLTDFNSMAGTPRKDYVRELVTAARDAGMKIGFYYSLLDWNQPDYRTDLTGFVNRFVFGQVGELCRNYGPIDLIWFDGEWDHTAEQWRAPELVRKIHQLQPAVLINDRLGKGERGINPLCDFYTREQPSEMNVMMPFERERPHPWEACMTIGDYWQYCVKDTRFKSVPELIRILVDVVSRGGNLLLNVGPNPDGVIPVPLVERLRGVGAWLAVNGESIYGTTGSPFKDLPAGRCTAKGNYLYLHLDQRPGPAVRLPGLQTTIRKAWFLRTGQTLPFDNATKTITLPNTLPDDAVTTIAMELDGPAVVR